MKKSVSILGSTGSIGCSTIDLIRRHPDDYDVVALTAHQQVDKLVEQAQLLRPKMAIIGDEGHFQALKAGLADTDIEVAAGPQALEAAAEADADWVMAAIVGAAGLAPVLKAVQRGAHVALANKECLVCAGELVMKEVARAGATLLPVDSEHNAIFQVFDFDQPDHIDRIILTGSGGPFRTRDRESLRQVTPAEAVAHPNWSMGAKISVASATMMNKGLEVIEAFHLFPLSIDQLSVVVHPQSIIHSMVEYKDGSILAQLGPSDMRVPIAHTLAWPQRMETPMDRLKLEEMGALTFEAPDEERFPALRLAREALAAGQGAPTILNAANEVAIEAFLDGRIGFLDITDMVAQTLDQVANVPLDGLETVAALDHESRQFATQLVTRLSQRH